MCYAIPGKVEKIDGRAVIVDYFGEKRKAINELADLSAGDYIYAQGGFVISKISPAEAESILHVWKEEFFNLQEVDLKISRVNFEQKGIDKKLVGILDKALENRPFKKEELLYLLNLRDESQIDFFLKTANFLRQKYHQNSCCVHGIIEISNYCGRNCLYCGISNQNKNLKHYRMSRQEILDAAHEAIENYGFKALVLQSGEDTGYNINELAGIIKEIKNNWPALIFVSFGEVGLNNLKVLYDAGVRGLLMRFETSNPQKYSQLHPCQSLETRIEHLKKAHEIGYLILTGGLIGLPGQTKEDILNDILLAKELRAEMFSFGPFLPHPDTALAGSKPVDSGEVIKVLALSRLINSENAKILVTTALETLDSQSRKKALLSGANTIMLNVTPMKYRQLYSIYPNRAHSEETIENQINETISLLRELGRAPTDLSI